MTTSTVLNIPLAPVTGDRFQPTGFPDLGAATFQAWRDGKWVPALHVESPQSMANRLELATWDTSSEDQPTALEGLPYVRVVNSDGEFITSSRLEAHRLGSAYVMDATHDSQTVRDWLPGVLGVTKNKALDHRVLAKGVFELDPLSLIHGVFFAQKEWAWQPKIARALTCFIDAVGVQPAVSGGVKTDSVNPKSVVGQGAGEGYGMVPHQRVEYVAQQITASVVIDRGQIASYGLSEHSEALLNALIDFELASVFRSDFLRLRTNCMLVADASSDGMSSIPSMDDATAALVSAIGKASGELGSITEVKWAGKGKS